MEEFKERVPELAKGLVEKLDEAHKGNKKFQAAFASFLTVCQQTLNPNISRAAVDEMLVQHLLTERLIRKIFDNPEFMHRNVIANEIEKVIDALVSLSFRRDDFLKSLDRFYRAIEAAAQTLEDFTEKQHFLNTVYERFFQGYSVKVADTHGIVYTPQEIVDFMCASVEEVLQKEFGLTLGSPGVNILDPCTGTGNFIVNLLNRIPKKDLVRAYREQLFANEVMLLPYYIAALNIEHAYWERTGTYESFDGLCFVDTLELAEQEQQTLTFMTLENTAHVKKQKVTPITVIVGNPPYNVGQLDENDNNKNRKYPVIEARIRETYAKDSTASNKNALSDAYVKFFRWATDRLEGRDGIVCFVTNNSFIDKIAFNGMRKHLALDFTRFFHVDLHGDVRVNPKLSGTKHNVFGIQVGVGITIAIRRSRKNHRGLFYHRVPNSWRKEEKLSWLSKHENVDTIEWQQLSPTNTSNWLLLSHADEFSLFSPIGSKESKSAKGLSSGSVFKLFSGGVKTNRDEVVYGFQRTPLEDRIQRFVDDYNGEVDRYKRSGMKANLDEFINYEKVNWSEGLKNNLVRGTYADFEKSRFRQSLYRPFSKKWLYFDALAIERRYLYPLVVPSIGAELENLAICSTNEAQIDFSALVTNLIPCLHLGGRQGQCFPFYVYDEDGTNRRENITDWALEQYRTHYADKKINKWEIFYYVYGLLHHPGYRTKFADNLKRELPRIPFAPDFRAFATAGKELAGLHLDYEKLEPHPLKWIESEGVPLSYKVIDKMRLSKDKTTLRVNQSLTLADIPPETFQYRLGNRSALDWVIDQYQVSEDKRSGIRSDPNREEDEEYIVRLVGQVVRVSLETVRIVAGLPEAYA